MDLWSLRMVYQAASALLSRRVHRAGIVQKIDGVWRVEGVVGPSDILQVVARQPGALGPLARVQLDALFPLSDPPLTLACSASLRHCCQQLHDHGWVSCMIATAWG